ncbi:MAG: 3'-5' exonuclease [Tahibacter sp.]
MTNGEKRFSQRLEDKLEDDYLVWYDVPIGPKRRQPDFVILHPLRGLLVLEVKDWKLETIHELTKTTATLRTERGLSNVANPLLQARTYALELVALLQRDSALLNPPVHPHAGKLVMPWGQGVVLTNITRAAFEANQLGNALSDHLVICQDEMTESADVETFQTRLWAMFTLQFRHALTLPQIDRIRWHLFPEIRVHAPTQVSLFDAPATAASNVLQIPDLVKVMDRQQEQLARSLGDGHRVIHGVAGSGKTMILGYRCLHLARVSAKPILVLCFNRTLAARLAQVIHTQTAHGQVDIRNFHAWCALMLRTYHVASPKGSGEAFFSAQVEAVIKAVEAGHIPRAQYGAVLIDEGHDFQPEWLQLIVQMLDPETNSLLLLYDDAQSIYAKRERRRFSFASVGVEARGRTTILKLNYRNTWEVLAVAKAFAAQLFDGKSLDEDAPDAIPPESVGRHGPAPQLIRCANRAAEADTIAALIDDARNDGCALDQIAVIWRHWRDADLIASALAKRNIAFVSAKDARSKDRLFDGEPSVKLVSMHSSKGLEFERVFIPALDSMPGEGDDAGGEAKLLYVAMTRAVERLVMTCVEGKGFVGEVEGAMGGCG